MGEHALPSCVSVCRIVYVPAVRNSVPAESSGPRDKWMSTLISSGSFLRISTHIFYKYSEHFAIYENKWILYICTNRVRVTNLIIY